MNSLTWTLYWVEVLGSLSTLAFALMGALLLIGGVAFCAVGVTSCDMSDGPKKQKMWGDFKYYSKRAFAVFIVALALCVVIPSKQTMYLMVASEVGERAYNSQPGQELARESMDTIKSVLKRLRNEGKEEKK